MKYSVRQISVVTSVFRYFSKNRYLCITYEITMFIKRILYFSDTVRLEEHFYIGFEEYLMLGRENGAKTCLRTTTTRMMNTVRALAFEESIVIQQILYFSDTARLEEHLNIGFEKYLMLGRENGAKTCIRTTERAIADWLPFNSRRNHSYIANTILFGYNTLRGALLCRF